MLKNRIVDDSMEDCDIDNQKKNEAKELVKDVYKNIKTLYGEYNPNHTSKFMGVFLICAITFFAVTPFAVIIWNLIAHKFEWWVNLVLLAFGIIFATASILFLKSFLKKNISRMCIFTK